MAQMNRVPTVMLVAQRIDDHCFLVVYGGREMHVIARAYGDQPLDRIIVQAGDNLVYVANPSVSRAAIESERTGVGFPAHCIFKYDPSLYHKLMSAWERGDRTKLTELWSAAEPEAVSPEASA